MLKILIAFTGNNRHQVFFIVVFVILWKYLILVFSKVSQSFIRYNQKKYIWIHKFTFIRVRFERKPITLRKLLLLLLLFLMLLLLLLMLLLLLFLLSLLSEYKTDHNLSLHILSFSIIHIN